MIDLEIVSDVIYRPIEEVFEYSNDPAKSAEWQRDVVANIPDGPSAVGTTGRWVQKFLGQEFNSKYTITAYNPPYEFSVHATSGPLWFDLAQTYEEVDGGTQITCRITGEAGGLFKLGEGAIKKQLASDFQRDFALLKAILEGVKQPG